MKSKAIGRKAFVRLPVANALAFLFVSLLSTATAHAICGDGRSETTFCLGDCDASEAVTVDEIVIMVSIALGTASAESCAAGDTDGSGTVTVDEIITAVDRALNGCGGGGAGEPGEEECDDGGLCIGGADAGDPCSAESDCEGDGACFGGLDNLRGCRSDDGCREGVCRKCRPYGGDGCAANCTLETDNNYALVPGEIALSGDEIVFGTSGSVVFGPFLTIPLPLTGTQVLTIGKVVDGEAPVVVKTSSVIFDAIPIANVACACVRGATAMTCGGAAYDADGVLSSNCTPGFGEVDECPASKKCAALHGPGNTGSGFITCGGSGVDVDFAQDCNSAPPGDPIITVTQSTEPISSDEGSAFLVVSSALATLVGSCTGALPAYGPDGAFCTDDDPIENRGMPGSIPFTTNAVEGRLTNTGIVTIGPLPSYATMGSPFSCNGDAVSVSGANLAGAFTACDQPTVEDIVVITNFAAE